MFTRDSPVAGFDDADSGESADGGAFTSVRRAIASPDGVSIGVSPTVVTGCWHPIPMKMGNRHAPAANRRLVDIIRGPMGVSFGAGAARVPNHNPNSASIDIRGLYKTYGRVHALEGVDLAIPPGVIFGFLGPNGAGKTTTLRVLMGLMRATAGHAAIFGLDVWRDSTRIRRDVGYLPGDARFYGWMRGTAFLAFCNRTRGGTHQAEITRLIDCFGLDAARRIRDYSAGMKQKLGLIQALMHRPKLLILDEPTTALDPLVQETLYSELRAAVKRGQTVLFSSHMLSEVERLCDRVAIIRRGRIIENATVGELRQRATQDLAIRPVEFTLRNGSLSQATIPPALHGSANADGRWIGQWRGPLDGLLPWLARLDVVDVMIGAPSLEDLFREYYRDDGEPSTERTAT